MKVLFLDNDGVICLSNNWGSRFKKQKKGGFLQANDLSMPVDLRFDNFDQKAIKILNKVLEKTGAEVVVSSDWKRWATLEEIGDYYESQGIIKRPIGMTKFFTELNFDSLKEISWSKEWKLEQERHFEILDWLSKHPEVQKWVAVDDLDMSVNGNWGLTNFVLTPRSNEGIKQNGVSDKLIKFLL
jgi:hypothetical protein